MSDDPAGNFAYVSHLGGDNVAQYSVRSDGGFTSLPVASVDTGDVPTDAVVSPDGDTVYVLNRGDSSISRYSMESDG